jgi:hypothetical protein
MGTPTSIQRQTTSIVQSSQTEIKSNEVAQQKPDVKSKADTAEQAKGSKGHATEKKVESQIAGEILKSELQESVASLLSPEARLSPEAMLSEKLYQSSDLAKSFTPMMKKLPAGSTLNYTGMTNANFSKDGTAKGGFEFKVQ